MVHFVVRETIGKANPDRGIPNAQPGSVEWTERYRASRDLRLTADARKAAAEKEAAADAAVWNDVVDQTIASGEAPPGYVIVSKPGDLTSAISAGRSLAAKWPCLYVVAEADVNDLGCHGFVPTQPLDTETGDDVPL